MNIVRFASSYIEPYPLQVVGEQSYREEIEEVVGFVDDEDGVNADDFIAQLILDDHNIYDPGNAVAVEINGKTVGYLAKNAAKKYREKIKELGVDGCVGECYASIKGGFIKKNTGEQADFGVRLDIVIDELKIYTPPLPKQVPLDVKPVTPPIIDPAIQIKPPKPETISIKIKKALSPAHFKTTILIAFLVISIILSLLNQLIERFR